MNRLRDYDRYSKMPTRELERLRVRFEEFLKDQEAKGYTLSDIVNVVWHIKRIIGERIGRKNK